MGDRCRLMGGPGRGSGLEVEQVGVGPGAGSPSEPTVLRDVELPDPRGEAMAGFAGAVRVSHTAAQSPTSPVWPRPRLGLCLDRLSPRAPSGMAERLSGFSRGVSSSEPRHPVPPRPPARSPGRRRARTPGSLQVGGVNFGLSGSGNQNPGPLRGWGAAVRISRSSKWGMLGTSTPESQMGVLGTQIPESSRSGRGGPGFLSSPNSRSRS